ncbi:hypothetical protein CSUB_C1444 [Candidatus Caldarchaeum subterraneum]|uniref:Uncharacterized protein n=1 Tax=Caldiarchaeum subterraneum TaxID=311458 RepID=E6N8E8_CALS0|nr:hypothetical protein HGMM_F04B03C33 [Candidatus Caldarchaeum subterraneum]BAJ48587.1 hypothetical protein HGMM_F30C12C05 [Candidatus Caldarchaeum subterraneum]BAJ51295.1 hypothetical protein CSUB_C1444 [Candidatus Caldarchaeum subterraneum]
MVAKTAIIPPSDGTANILFITILIAVMTLHILTIILGSRKLAPQLSTAPLLPTPIHQPLPRPKPASHETQPPQEDYLKRLEKLDETLKMLEEKIKNQPAKNPEPAKTTTPNDENTREQEPVQPVEEDEIQSPESLEDIIRLARELKEELNTLMKTNRQNAVKNT